MVRTLGAARFDGLSISSGRADVPAGDDLRAGAILAAGRLDIERCIFSDNFAAQGPAAISAPRSLVLKDSSFTSNVAGTWGSGAVEVGGTSADSTTLDNVVFEKNVAQGALFATVNVGTPTTVRNCTFSRNTGDQNGAAALYVLRTTASITGTTFDSNTGPAVTNDSSEVEIADSTIKAGSAGVVNTFLPTKTTIRNVTFYGIAGIPVFGQGNGSVGGPNYCSLDIKGSRFLLNQRGAVSTYDCELSVSDTLFESNTGADQGGAIQHSTTSGIELAIERTIFKANVATADGGSIYYANAPARIVASTFESNSAGANGGAIAGRYPISLRLDSCRMFDNRAAMNGGVVSLDNANVTLENSLAYGNSAQGGAVIYRGSGAGLLVIVNSTLSLNRASSAQSGAIDAHGTKSIQNSILWGDSPSEVPAGTTLPNTPDSLLVDFSDIQGSSASTIQADPKFADPASFDFHLSAGSPCIDAADDSIAPPMDLDGHPRRSAAGAAGCAPDAAVCVNADVGAFEFGG